MEHYLLWLDSWQGVLVKQTASLKIYTENIIHFLKQQIFNYNLHLFSASAAVEIDNGQYFSGENIINDL